MSHDSERTSEYIDSVRCLYLAATTSGARNVNSSFVSDGMFSFSPFVNT